MPGLTQNDLAALRINRTYSAVLADSGMILFGFCFKVAVSTYVELNNDPAWLKALMYIISYLVYLSPPAFIYYLVERRLRRVTKDVLARMSEIERIIDPLR